MNGWIKIHRKLLEWEWYNDSNMVHLFIHLIVLANHKPNNWRGINIKKGQLITGRKKLSKETGISEQSIRTCLNKLKSTSELTIKPTNKYSLITICNYGDYQIKDDKTNQQINQQTPNNQPTTNHKQECKECKEEYDRYISESNDETYNTFVKYLFGENEVKVPFEKCLSLKDQISPDNFKTLMSKYPKDLIKIKVNAMENTKDLLKKYSSFYRTLNNWCLKG